ncbi:unnamed protein product [Auanema sp. JU1783]|nr:unnamed protein product [Auanema sp. JU1783]
MTNKVILICLVCVTLFAIAEGCGAKPKDRPSKSSREDSKEMMKKPKPPKMSGSMEDRSKRSIPDKDDSDRELKRIFPSQVKGRWAKSKMRL